MRAAIIFFAIILSSYGRKVVILDNNEWDSVDVTSAPLKINPQRFKNFTKGRSFSCDPDDSKCLYDMTLQESHKNDEMVKKFLEKFASVTNVKINDEHRNNSKAYWNQINAEKHNHPYDDKKGWVTLDPIPWSSSQISKWESNNKPADHSPWSYNPLPAPSQQQFWVSANNHNTKPTSNWNLGYNDILTDQRPGGFPVEDSQKPYRPTEVSGKPMYSYHQIKPTIEVSSSNYNYPQSFYKPTTTYQPETTRYPSVSHHPSTYPTEGTGQWVLLSTTKGYSIPQRYYDRKFQVRKTLGALDTSAPPEIISRSFKSRYAENKLDNDNDKYTLVTKSTDVNRKSGEEFGNNENVWNINGINIVKRRNGKNLYDAESPVISVKRQVRLTVLPSLSNTSTTTYDGMLEVDDDQRTVEEHKLAEDRLEELRKIASVTSSIQHPHTIIHIGKSSQTDMDKKKKAILAAVGAGMLPATMAMLLPVALGRRKRSLTNGDDLTGSRR